MFPDGIQQAIRHAYTCSTGDKTINILHLTLLNKHLLPNALQETSNPKHSRSPNHGAVISSYSIKQAICHAYICNIGDKILEGLTLYT